MSLSVRAALASAWVGLLFSPLTWAAPPVVIDRPAAISRLASVTPLTAVGTGGDRFVAVGPRGHVLVRPFQGTQWRQVAVPTSSDLTAVHFVSATVGWAVGHGGVVLKTTNGGEAWVRQLDGRAAAKRTVAFYEDRLAHGEEHLRPFLEEARKFVGEGAVHPLLSVWFKDGKEGFVVGAFNTIFRTEDGGTTWVPWMDRTDNPGALHLTSVVGDGRQVYVVGEQGLILRLDERTQRFSRILSPYKGTFFGAIVPKAESLIVFGMRGSAFLTEDDGVHWRQIDSGDPSALTAAALLPSGEAAFVTQSGRVLVYRAGAGRLEPMSIPRALPYAGVAAANDGSVAVVGFGGASVTLPSANK